MSNTVVLEQLFNVANINEAPGEVVKRQRIYILPTYYGFIFALLLIVMLLGAINYNNNMAYILTFLLGSMYILAIIHTYRNLAGLSINSKTPLPVFAGQAVSLQIIFDNRHGSLRSAIALQRAPETRYFWKRYRDSKLMLTHIDENCFSHARLSIPAVNRGIFPVPRIMISSTYPLGLFRAWSYLQFNLKFTVYPTPAGRKGLVFKQISDNQGKLGETVGMDDFSGFRRYQHGDSVRNIFWKAAAREQEILVKKFSGIASAKVNLDMNDVNHLDTIEQRLSQLCLWILEAEQSGMEYQLSVSGKTIPYGYGKIHQHLCLETLAGYGYTKH